MIIKIQKVLLVIFSLIITLLLLEVSLRFAGFIYKTYRFTQHERIKTKEDKDIVKILCLGDSFTFGLGAESGYDYPAQLERLLNKNFQDRKFIVYNQGIPGQNSSMVLKRLTHNINTYKPDMILLLIGSNNSTVLEDSNYYLFKKSKIDKITNFFLKLDILFSKLRTYKLIRITILNIKNKFKSKKTILNTAVQRNPEKAEKGSNKILKENPGSKEKEIYLKLAESFYSERKFSAAEKSMKEIPGGWNLKDKRECFLLSNIYYEQEKYGLALNAMGDYIKNNPKDSDSFFNLGRIYYMQGRNNPIIRENNFKQAIIMFKELLLSIDPQDLFRKAETYSYLSRLYLDQGKKELAIKMIEEALKYYPDNNFFRQFRRVINGQILSQEENGIFNKLLYYDLGQIINLCHLYNVKIILLNYPPERDGGPRKEIAEKNGAPFINIGARFSELLTSNYKYKDLFSDNADHPNASGYRLMAETVFEVLKPKLGALR